MTEQTTELEAELHNAIRDRTSGSIRDAFRRIDLTDIEANAYEFPIPEHQVPGFVGEGEVMPREGLSYESKTVRFDKFGFEVTDDCDADDIEDAVSVFKASIAHHAYAQIDAELNTTFRTTDSKLDIIENAIVEAGNTVLYDKQDTVVLSETLAESIAETDPTREWRELRSDLEDEYGIAIVADEFNTMAGSDVLVVDSDRFAYGCVKTDFTTDNYTEYKEHSPITGNMVPEDEREIINEVVQAYVRLGFVVIDDEAAHRVRFTAF